MTLQIDRIDGLSSATAVKGPCKVATTANITLAGQQTIDGIQVLSGDRVLVKNQVDARENGIWIADTGVWRRSSDFKGNRDVRKGTRVWVTDGDNGPAEYAVASDNPVNVGSDDILIVLAASLINVVGTGLDFATKALAEAYSPAAAPLYMRTQGYWAAGDGGGALYRYVVSEPSHPGKISIALEGGLVVAWYELAPGQIYSDRMFGAKADDVTDDTQALKDFAAFYKAKGGGHARFDGGSRRIWPAAQPHQTVLMDIRGTKGVIEYVNGAEIHAVTPNSATDATTRWGIIFDITGSSVQILNPRLRQDGAALAPFSAGVLHFVGSLFSAGVTRGFKATGVVQNGGIGGLIIYRAASQSRDDISRDIVLEGDFTKVYYPANFQGNGDDARINIKTTDCGRSYFPYNVSGHRARIDSNNGTAFDDAEVACYTDPAFRNQTTDIEIWYRLRRTGAELTAGNMVQIGLTQSDATSRPCTVENIKVHYDVRVAAYPGSVFSLVKSTNLVTSDNSPRGHTVRHIKLDGIVDGAFSQNPIQIFSRDNWTGDFCYEVALDELSASFNPSGGATVTIDGRGLNKQLGGVRIHKTRIVDTPIVLTNMDGKASITESYINGSYTDGNATADGITWYAKYLPGGRLQLLASGVNVPSAGRTVILPFTDAQGAAPKVIATPENNYVFNAKGGAANTIIINHGAGAAMLFGLLVEMNY